MRDHLLAVGKADLISAVAVDEQDLAGRDDGFGGHAVNFG